MIPREVFAQTLLSFLAPVRQYLDDPEVTEIMINGPFEIFIEKAGRIHKTSARFENRDVLEAAMRNLAQFVGKKVSEQQPILEARLPDGSRVEAVFPPASPDGPHVAIRRFFQETLTIERLLKLGSVSKPGADLLSALVGAKQNIIVAGGTGSGKTSMLNVLSSFVDGNERVVVIEDNRELQLQGAHVVQFEARPPDARGRGEISVRELFRATLRMRPDRIVVGEIRGGEALDLVQAMISGHGGCLSTVHATYPIDTLNRLETMALMSDIGLPHHALRAQIASAIDIVVQTARLQDGSRCVTHISEVRGYTAEHGYQVTDLFKRRVVGRSADGRVLSEFVSTGEEPRCVGMIESLGLGTISGPEAGDS
ncbi:MAG: Flp pilus assembly complex ATPase component TadA [Deltaproteobacteria bacterium]|nr:Flp pilus assembly complex ATPase component TadA [Deltaproteobacteria bacterium]